MLNLPATSRLVQGRQASNNFNHFAFKRYVPIVSGLALPLQSQQAHGADWF
jgi:hypothetical protein